MKHFLFILVFFLSLSAQGQIKILFLGNYEKICFTKDSIEIIESKKLPESILEFKAILIFSNAESCLTQNDIVRLESYINEGGGIYCGADNWPLQAESQQVTMALYVKECWGNFNKDSATIQLDKTSNQLFTKSESFPVGKTTVAFPLDYRLKVEVWLEDQPLILTGNYGNGKIVIDCGYSRFYCETMDDNRNGILESIIYYLDD